ncbi:hypothetical protein OH784_20060 [Ectobacillus funiculus]|uniref:hypothetical protein n=1 Tax=Ectobacillus funiculus TaxID=137993 RepID=UPI003978EED5
MGVYIEKFIVVNNYGTIEFRDGQRDVSFSASKANNGALGPTVADFVNGRRVRNLERERLNEAPAVEEESSEEEEMPDLSSGLSF